MKVNKKIVFGLFLILSLFMLFSCDNKDLDSSQDDQTSTVELKFKTAVLVSIEDTSDLSLKASVNGDQGTIYAVLSDKDEMPETYDKVYLSITAKAQEGTPTINIFVNTTYTDWTTSTICWDNSKLHQDTLALIKDTPEDPETETQ